jgi:isopenicillin N synthase-like dioxygenase
LTLVKSVEPGLEIEVGEHYHAVDLLPESILVMPGSILSLMTGNRIPPLRHRVRNASQLTDRASILFFVNPNLAAPPKAWFRSALAEGEPDIAQATRERSTAFGLPSIGKVVI